MHSQLSILPVHFDYGLIEEEATELKAVPEPQAAQATPELQAVLGLQVVPALLVLAPPEP